MNERTNHSMNFLRIMVLGSEVHGSRLGASAAYMAAQQHGHSGAMGLPNECKSNLAQIRTARLHSDAEDLNTELHHCKIVFFHSSKNIPPEGYFFPFGLTIFSVL